METEYDFVSALLAIGDGGVEFFASCLLHLDPDQLKACRLVNSAWDEFVRKEVWGSKVKRLLLKENRLPLHRMSLTLQAGCLTDSTRSGLASWRERQSLSAV